MMTNETQGENKIYSGNPKDEENKRKLNKQQIDKLKKKKVIVHLFLTIRC